MSRATTASLRPEAESQAPAEVRPEANLVKRVTGAATERKDRPSTLSPTGKEHAPAGQGQRTSPARPGNHSTGRNPQPSDGQDSVGVARAAPTNTAAKPNTDSLAPHKTKRQHDSVVEDYFEIPRWQRELKEKAFDLKSAAPVGIADLRLEGLPATLDGIPLRFKQDAKPNVWSVKTEQSSYGGSPIATFSVNERSLLFAWDGRTSKQQGDKVWPILRNCVLTLSSSESESHHYALRAPLECKQIHAEPALPDDPELLLGKSPSYRCVIKPVPRSEVRDAKLYIDRMVLIWRGRRLLWKKQTDQDWPSISISPNQRSSAPFRVSRFEIADERDKARFVIKYVSVFEVLSAVEVALAHDRELIEIVPRTQLAQETDTVPSGSRARDVYKLKRLSIDLRIEAAVLYMRVDGIRVDVYRIGSLDAFDAAARR